MILNVTQLNVYQPIYVSNQPQKKNQTKPKKSKTNKKSFHWKNKNWKMAIIHS